MVHIHLSRGEGEYKEMFILSKPWIGLAGTVEPFESHHRLYRQVCVSINKPLLIIDKQEPQHISTVPKLFRHVYYFPITMYI